MDWDKCVATVILNMGHKGRKKLSPNLHPDAVSIAWALAELYDLDPIRHIDSRFTQDVLAPDFDGSITMTVDASSRFDNEPRPVCEHCEARKHHQAHNPVGAIARNVLFTAIIVVMLILMSLGGGSDDQFNDHLSRGPGEYSE
jgi:hypothetical protein